MISELGQIGPFTIRTYTLMLDIAIVAGLGVLSWRGWHLEDKAVEWADAGLGGILGGVIFGRIGHVAVHWGYFSSHQSEIIQVWRGGIDWHGAVLGGLFVLWIISTSRRLIFKQIADELSLILPFAALMIYGGCLTTRCGHGREVASLTAYAPLMASELPDLYGLVAPRLASQFYGIVLSISLLILSFWFARTIRRRGIRFWLILMLLAIGTFLIGYTRGDAVPMVGRLRIDQVFDLLIAGVSLIGIILTGRFFRRRRRPQMRITRLTGPARVIRRRRRSAVREERDQSDE